MLHKWLGKSKKSYKINNFCFNFMKEQLLKNFASLDDQEQDIVLALAIVYMPVGQTNLQKKLTLSQCTSKSTANLVAKPLREKLLDLELIETLQEGWICSRQISESLMRVAVGRADFFTKITTYLLNETGYIGYNVSHLHLIKLMRIALYQGREDDFLKQFNEFRSRYQSYDISVSKCVFFDDFDENWFNGLGYALRMEALQDYQMMHVIDLKECTAQYQIMNACFQESRKAGSKAFYGYVDLHLYRGDIDGLEALLTDNDSGFVLERMGALRFLQNRYAESIDFFEQAIKVKKS